MNKTTYQNAMRQITAEKEEILMKAKQMQAQYNAQNPAPKHGKILRRGMRTGIAAAAALLLCGTVTVGAVNHWDYAAVFSKYFEAKSGEPVYYDFTGMGLDIGQEIVKDDYTVNVNSVLADTGAVYVAYDIRLSDEIKAQLADYTEVYANGGIWCGIIKEGEEGTYSPEMQSINASCDENGIYHAMTILKMDAGTSLADKQLEITPNMMTIHYVTNPEDGTGDHIDLNKNEEFTDERYVYDLSGITVQEGITIPYGKQIPNDSNENIYDTLYLTPFMMRFESQGDISAYENAPKYGMTFTDPDPALYHNDPRFKEVPETYTAVYADGTEIPLKLTDGSAGSMSSRNEETGGYHWVLNVTHFFAAPLDFDGLTAIRVNDTEVPLP